MSPGEPFLNQAHHYAAERMRAPLIYAAYVVRPYRKYGTAAAHTPLKMPKLSRQMPPNLPGPLTPSSYWRRF
jgi:hypothetical protein